MINSELASCDEVIIHIGSNDIAKGIQQEKIVKNIDFTTKKLKDLKGSVSSSIPCTCRLLASLCLSPFLWAMKMATTKENQETTRARHAG